MHLSVSFVEKGEVVSWEVVPKLKKDCPAWFVITFCHGFLTIWTKNSESKGGKGHENVESFYVKPTLPARDLSKVSFPLWHFSFVILLVGPLGRFGKVEGVSVYPCTVTSFVGMEMTSAPIAVSYELFVKHHRNPLFQSVNIPLFQPIYPACRFQTKLSGCETFFSSSQSLLPMEFAKGTAFGPLEKHPGKPKRQAWPVILSLLGAVSRPDLLRTIVQGWMFQRSLSKKQNRKPKHRIIT